LFDSHIGVIFNEVGTVKERSIFAGCIMHKQGEMFINILFAPFFCMKVFFEAFLFSTYKFGIGIFGPKNIGTKAAHKMLMKLTTTDKFIRVINDL